MDWLRRHIQFFDADYTVHQISGLKLWRCRFCHKLAENGSRCPTWRYWVKP